MSSVLVFPAGVRAERTDGEDPHGPGHHHHPAEPARRDRLLRGADQKVTALRQRRLRCLFEKWCFMCCMLSSRWCVVIWFGSTFNWSVPFLSGLAVLVFVIATVLTYYVPVRYVILLWGTSPLNASPSFLSTICERKQKVTGIFAAIIKRLLQPLSLNLSPSNVSDERTGARHNHECRTTRGRTSGKKKKNCWDSSKSRK